MSRRSADLCCTVVLLLAPCLCSAIEPIDRFALSVGAFDLDDEMSLRWDSYSGTLGTQVEFQRDLGFKSAGTRPYWQVSGLLGQRHRLSAFGYEYDTRGARSLTQNYTIGDSTFVVGADFSGRLDTRRQGVAYTWLLRHRERSALGIGLGAVRYALAGALDASLNSGTSTVTERERFSEAEWAPLLRIETSHSLGQDFRLGAEAAYARGGSGSVSGHVIDAHVRIEYFPWEHIGFQLRYHYNDLDLTFDRDTFLAEVELRNRGPQLLATYRF